MEIVSHLAALVVGVGAGFWGYRYALKKDPDALENWAQRLKRERDELLRRDAGQP